MTIFDVEIELKYFLELYKIFSAKKDFFKCNFLIEKSYRNLKFVNFGENELNTDYIWAIPEKIWPDINKEELKFLRLVCFP